MERFTQRARRVLSLAQEEAEQMHHSYIGTEHLLLGLIREEGGVAGRVLRELGLDPGRVENLVERMTRAEKTTSTERLELSPGTKKVLELAVDEARRLGHHYIGTEHLLLGLMRQPEGVAIDVLRRLGVSPEEIRRQTRRVLQENPSPTARTEGGESSRRTARQRPSKDSKTPLVDQLATDLTEKAEKGELDPVIGRETEIERVIQILSRRNKNNPALIGEPGVGKTAIVEGLAQRIVNEETPRSLLGKRVLQLDVGSLVAGTMYRGQFEERLKRVIEELKSSDSILFIDEVHMLVGAGSAGSSVDAANILKPALARGELQCIGATTFDEYRKHIESDAALERRFQPVHVDEPSIEETVEILKGLRPNFEAHHDLEISDESIEAAAHLSARYVTDRYMPDKAIDLVDEGSARVRMYKSPESMRVRKVQQDLRDLREKMEYFADDYDAEQRDDMQMEIGMLEKVLDTYRANWNPETNRARLNAEDVAEVVSMLTGIPVTQIAGEESARLLQMEDHLRSRIVGQEEAIESISKAVRRARAGLKDPGRPIGSFIFLGPTGVGKTELTKALAEFLFGSEDALIQLDMSEFMERHNVARLVGAPPGYVGYEEAGQLTEAIRRRPYSIVVFDEIEKAHPEAFNMLLQIMEEGHLSDARGRMVDFRNAIIIMTSNIGADTIRKGPSLGFGLPSMDETRTQEMEYNEMRKTLMDQLRRAFRPEFINRLDGVVVFRALTQRDITEIVDLRLSEVRERLLEHALMLNVTQTAKNYLASEGYDPEFGARPLRRVITNLVEDKLSDGILGGKYPLGGTVLVDLDEATGELTFANVEEKEPEQPEPSA
ncbi:MAG: ATP-dependent Clp protease ATP-binding subunit [Anaerolineae bacterium]|nr:ATP-dependent Clp protease ATP-binding subunit [Anaerolineae bacterium]